MLLSPSSSEDKAEEGGNQTDGMDGMLAPKSSSSFSRVPVSTSRSAWACKGRSHVLASIQKMPTCFWHQGGAALDHPAGLFLPGMGRVGPDLRSLERPPPHTAGLPGPFHQWPPVKLHHLYCLAPTFGLLSINLHVNLVLQALGYGPSVLWWVLQLSYRDRRVQGSGHSPVPAATSRRAGCVRQVWGCP